jgi:hypothetical protein
VAVIAYPLALASTDLIAREKEQSTLEDQVTLWLTGRNTQIQEIEVGETDRFRVSVDLTGPLSRQGGRTSPRAPSSKHKPRAGLADGKAIGGPPLAGKAFSCI